MKTLRDKIMEASQPVIFYELLPPTGEKAANTDAYIDCAIDLLTSTPVNIDGVNIPEIRDENKGEQRTDEFVPKMDPRHFAERLEQAYRNINVVLNHCTVYEGWEEQKAWLEHSANQTNLRALILVGGSSSKIDYIGPSVIEMLQYIRTHYTKDLFCGGITIQTRRSHDAVRDEPHRLLAKSLNGMEFFTSQIIYDPISMKFLLRDYAYACREEGIEPKRIFLSFAPVSSHKDLHFLRWLGVFIPKTVEDELFKADIGIGWRSLKIATNNLLEILQFMHKEKIQVPLGLNIEHVSRHNFELSLEFVERLGDLYYSHVSKLP
ncbi:hypothetical protein DIZ81_06755 [Legionella taurinensis]|uniref:Uncharacterized protein n=1 Tax=Legionella taurinensis TaxID=70611 RepID=A0A3A5LAG4_9GAMM|nr:methylenetetrahydrofolate reductase [Legionella taurinensis]MDX1837229.1 methylenetetrahydrofolate reductase [Legionella taurinensis]PUT40298.1 hypothetical protein DB744_06755 [Legionella taurinensis]PUT41532.1 hypothetical protein DB746_09265 [Legionella taurinensis]PUT44398.1 hypothetical protein DB743_08480 [Legionella taurinensis]PUT48360.1 hypothetical protein DB745_05155 [Legionella taurinensis]